MSAKEVKLSTGDKATLRLFDKVELKYNSDVTVRLAYMLGYMGR